MSLSVLVEGVLVAVPVKRISSAGKPFASASVRAKGDDGNPVFVSVIAFDAEAVEAVASLTKGDPVALVGPATLKTWEKNGEHRAGLSVTATRVLSLRKG